MHLNFIVLHKKLKKEITSTISKGTRKKGGEKKTRKVQE